jgi:hypothetical protein
MTYRETLPMSALPDPQFHADLYAGVPFKRLVAWGIDLVLVGLITAVLVPLTLFTALFYLPLLVLAVSFVYRWITIAAGSATPGMRFVAIEFRNREGRRFDASEAMLHTLGFLVSTAVFPLQLVSIALMLLSDRGQGLTDHVMGSTALNRRAAF